MAKPWDGLLKRLVAANPQHFVNWLLPGAQFESEKSLELKSRTVLLSIAYMLASLVFEKQSERAWLKRRFTVFQDILKESWAYQEILREGLEEGREQGLEEGLQALRQTLVSFIEMHFPTIAPLAKEQSEVIKDPAVLQNLIVKLFTARTAEEARQYLVAAVRDEKQN